MEYLSQGQIEEIHDTFVTAGDQQGGVRNYGILALAYLAPWETDPEGNEYHPSLFQKAAVYAVMIARFQPFNDGNRRTALASSAVFLRMNGYSLSIKDPATYLTEVKDSVEGLDEVAKEFEKDSTVSNSKDFAGAFKWFRKKYADDIDKMGDLP